MPAREKAWLSSAPDSRRSLKARYGRWIAPGVLACLAAPFASAAQPEVIKLYRSSYRVIDVHTHGILPTKPALQAHLDVMEATGVDAFTLLLYDGTGWPNVGGWSESNLEAWLQLRREFPARLNVFGTVDFNRVAKEPGFFQAIVTELQAAVAQGMQGVKIWKNLGMHHRDASGALLAIDDPRLDPFWAKCGELGVPVLIHTADPREYWYPNSFNTFQYKQGSTGRYFQHPVAPPWEELMRQRNHVLEKHPKTTFIGAHFASLTSDFDELARLLDAHPNLVVECGARLRFLYRYHPQAIRDFFVKYQDRILFGTDVVLIADEATLNKPQMRQAWKDRLVRAYSNYLEYFETDHWVTVPADYQTEWLRLKGLRLPPAILEKFYHGNAERVIRGAAGAGSPGAPAAVRE